MYDAYCIWVFYAEGEINIYRMPILNLFIAYTECGNHRLRVTIMVCNLLHLVLLLQNFHPTCYVLHLLVFYCTCNRNLDPYSVIPQYNCLEYSIDRMCKYIPFNY